MSTEELVARCQDMWALMRHLRGMGESNAVRARKAHVARRALDRAPQIYEERFAHPLGGVQATLELCHVIGWKADAAAEGRGGVDMTYLETCRYCKEVMEMRPLLAPIRPTQCTFGVSTP